MTHHPNRFHWFRPLSALAALTLLSACSPAEKEASEDTGSPAATNAPVVETVVAVAPPAADVEEAAGTKPTASPTDEAEADEAWATLVRESRPPNPPEDWRTREPTEEEQEAFRKEAIAKIREAATLAQEFVAKYPDNRNAGAAKLKERDLLSILEQLGDSTVGGRLSTLSTEMLNDGDLSDDQQFQARLRVLQQEVVKLQADQPALSRYVGKTVLEMKAELPDHPGIAGLLMEGFQISKAAQDEETAGKLEDELWTMHQDRMQSAPEDPNSYDIILNLASLKARAGDFEGFETTVAKLDPESVPDQVKQMMENIQESAVRERAKYERVGKEIDLSFTAIDGTEFNLQDLRGKVVLVDFWATWCGPCIAALPEVKVAYQKLHEKGFEIVGISLDDDLDAMKQFIARQKMPWPQYFDGKGWENEIAQRFGISSIPATWLIDKEGKLRHMEVRGNLVEMVGKLLDEEI